jgi:hypothetical protein
VQESVLRNATANATVIYNGVDTEMFAPSPAPNAEASPVILSVGNLIPIKGHELLLRAFAAIHPRHPHLSCELIGEGLEQPRLSRLAAELGIANQVRFLGRRSRRQVAEAMSRCLLFALPSRYEGLGCVYLEAMSSGKAVIGCKGQGIEEIVHDGIHDHPSNETERNGWLIEPGNLPAMTEALSQLVQDRHLRLQMGAAARRAIEQKYTLAVQAALLAQIYRE